MARDKLNPEAGIDDASDDDPGGVEKDGNELDSDGNDGRQVNGPWREALLVEDTSCNQEPGVDFNSEQSTHHEAQIGIEIGDHHV